MTQTSTNSQLALQLPASLAQPVFVATARMTEWFTVRESQSLEFSVDLRSANSPDTFAVLAWVPQSAPVTAFQGYFIAKSSREVRVGKAINKYFYRATPSSALKNQNVTLMLDLTGTNGNVAVEAKVLDLDAGGAVLFDQTFLDTSAADNLQAGSDNPPAPYTGKGRFVLMAYAELEPGGPDPREVDFANAVVSPPAPTFLLPVIHDISVDVGDRVPIQNSASFVGPARDLRFYATSNKPWDVEQGIAAAFGTGTGGHAFGVVTGDPNSFVGDTGLILGADALYDFALTAVFLRGVSNVTDFYFDAFSTNNLVIEAEDYNFGGGKFIDSPVLTAEGAAVEADAYRGQVGVAGTDFAYQAKGVASRYRTNDAVGTKWSLDYVRPELVAAGGANAGFVDYDVFGLNGGDYLQYTRTFSNQFYRVYLRESVVNLGQSAATLEVLGTNTTRADLSRRPLGYFLGHGSDFLYRNVPLTDSAGSNVVVQLDGVETLRLQQGTAVPSDAQVSLNYLVLVPVPVTQPALESAAVVTGPYVDEPGASVNTNAMTVTITVPASGLRFYRLRGANGLKVTGVAGAAGQLVIGYSE